MKNIHLIPTDKPSRLHLGNSGLVLCDLNFSSDTINGQHLYITSDEEIKEGDWVVFNELEIVKCTYSKNGEFLFSEPLTSSSNHHFSYFKKIILTTDQDLIKDGVQAIDDNFLEWFVKNPSCEEVEVEKICNNCGEINCIHAVCSSQIALKKGVTYKIIIPNEESKQEFCDNCNNDICCCIVKNQETLKEYLKSRLLETKYPSKMQCAEIGAKWQAERMYSEEDIKNALHSVELKDNKSYTKIYTGMKEYLDNLKN